MSLRPSERKDARRNRYKVRVDAEDGRRRREDDMVQIRKNTREENLKKRREGMHSVSTSSNVLEVIPSLVAAIFSEDIKLQLEATTNFRKIISEDQGPRTIEEVVQSGVLPRLAEFLARDDFPQLQFEAAWVFTNVAYGTSDHTNAIVACGAVPLFVDLMSSTCEFVREQAAWALGNIASDSTATRDFVLSHGALSTLLELLNDHARLSTLRNVAWTLSCFCKGKPKPPIEQMKLALPALRNLIYLDDQQALIDACRAVSFLSDGSKDEIQAFIDYGFCPRLMELIRHTSPLVQIPALRSVGNIVTGDITQIQVVINHQALPRLLELLRPNNLVNIQKEACWTVSNIALGSVEHIQAVLEAGIVKPLVDLLLLAEFDVKKEAAWAIFNILRGGSHEQIKHLVVRGCIIQPLCNLLVCPDTLLIKICLEGLGRILNAGEAEKSSVDGREINIYASLIEEAGGVDKIEGLQFHNNVDIYLKATTILEVYWLGEKDEEFSVADYTLARVDHPSLP